MPRSLYQNTIMVKGPAGAIPLAGAAVAFFDAETGAPIAFPLYADGLSTTPLALPYLTGDLGELEVWADRPHRVQITVTKNGLTQARETVDLEYPPDYGATDEDITNALTAHEASDDPHDQYLTQPEGDLLYLPLSYVPPVTDLSNYYTKPESDARYLPIDYAPPPVDLSGYQTTAEKGQPGGYAPVDPGGLIPTQYLPPLAITDTFVAASQAEQLALTAQVGDICIRTDEQKTYILAVEPASAFANWTELASAGGVQSVDGRVGVVDLSDRYAPFVHNHDLSYLSLAGGALTGPLTITGKNVGLSIDSGNTLEWRANGFYSAASGSGGGAANASVVSRQEFAPAAAATTVVLASAPVEVLSVTRNGVEQSQAAGNYSLAGSTLTFTDAFAAGERVGVVYEAGFSAQVNATLLAREEFAPTSGTTVTLSQTPTSVLEVSRNGVAQSLAAGDYSVAGAVVTFTDAFPNESPPDRVLVVYSVGTSVPTDTYTKTESDARYLQSATAATTYLPLTGGTLSGALRVNANVGVGVAPGAWLTDVSVLQVGQTAVFRGHVASANLGITNNQFVDTAGVNKAIVAGAAGAMSIGIDGTLTYSTAPSVAAGAAQTYTVRLTVNQAGVTAIGTTPAAWGGAFVPMQIGQVGAIWADATGPNVRFNANTYFDGAASRAIITGAGAQFSMGSGTFYWYIAPSVAAGAAQTHTERMRLDTNGTLQLAPIAPQPSINLNANPGIVQTSPAGSLIFRANGGYNIYVNPTGGQFIPEGDNIIVNGYSGMRWAAVYAVNGAIQTCRAGEKDILGVIDPGWALDAVLKTPIKRFHPKTGDGTTDATLTFAGIVDDSADPRMQIGAGSQTSPSHQAAMAMAAIQALAAEVAALKARLA